MIHRTGRRLIYIGTIFGFCAGVFVLAEPVVRLSAFASQFPICIGAAQTTAADEADFLAATATAMTKMMADMTIGPAGDVDSDFVSMMVPHHQGAIEMAQAELRYGRNERLRRIAQEIIVTQQQEITAMRLAMGQPLPSSVPAPDQVLSVKLNNSKSNLEP